MMRWANVPSVLEAAGIEEEDAVETASLVVATVSPFVPFRLPERFGTLLLMQSAPERVRDDVERTVLGPVLTGKTVTRAWYRYEFSDDALPLIHLAGASPGEGVLLEVPMDEAARQTPLFVDLGEDEQRLLGVRGGSRAGLVAPAAPAPGPASPGPQRPGRSGGRLGRRRADGGMTVRGGPGPRARTGSPENATGARPARFGLRDLQLYGLFGRRRSEDRNAEEDRS